MSAHAQNGAGMPAKNGAAPAATQPRGGGVATIDDRMEVAVSNMRPKFEAVLPSYIPVDRYLRTALISVSRPEIMAIGADPDGRQSIYKALLAGAADGLLIDGREAALVPMKAKVKITNQSGGVVEVEKTLCQYMPMVAGIRKKARNSGEIADIVCQCVYRNDVFFISFVCDGPPIKHEPNLEDRGEMLGVYALVKYRDGGWSQPEWMTKAQVDVIRARSRAKDGPAWKDNYGEMARKTVLKRAAKNWPASTDRDGRDLHELIRADDALTDLGVLDAEPQRQAPEAPRKQIQGNRLLANAGAGGGESQGGADAGGDQGEGEPKTEQKPPAGNGERTTEVEGETDI